MANWKAETGKYLPRLEALCDLAAVNPPHPAVIPLPPLDDAPTPIQAVIQRAITFYQIGIWCRVREATAGLLCLWKGGYLSVAGSLVRLLFELWAACEYQTEAISRFEKDSDLEKLSRTVNRLFEGVRDEVVLPWGRPASEKSIHVMDTIRHLSTVFPDAEATYNELCESAHANQPRFFEWWVTGKLGDNWSNKSVQKRGHALLEKTVASAEVAVRGAISSSTLGIQMCGALYETE